MYEFYRKLLDEGLDSYFETFIQTEELFAKDYVDNRSDAEKLIDALEWEQSDAHKIARNLLKH